MHMLRRIGAEMTVCLGEKPGFGKTLLIWQQSRLQEGFVDFWILKGAKLSLYK